MAEGEELLRTIETVHAAGLDESLWPVALGSITHLVGGVGTTFEVADKQSRTLRDFWSFGIPAASEIAYAQHYLSVNPRYALGMKQRAGDIGYDSMVIDEKTMRSDPYYAEFLQGVGLRYFVSSTIGRTSDEFACVAVQRSPRQGHATKRECALLRRLTPHLLQAFDTTMRLRDAHKSRNAFGDALDWLADGVLLLREDGKITYCNHAMQRIARRNDGIRIARNQIAFRSPAASKRFRAALFGVTQPNVGDGSLQDTPDFPVLRTGGGPSYLFSVRPVARDRSRLLESDAVAIVFVHDPLMHGGGGLLLREMFGFTEAETNLAEALQAGKSFESYARERKISLNTVYTHLQRIKDKTGCRRLPELISKLNEVHTTLRAF